jgi:hypothetical protein
VAVDGNCWLVPCLWSNWNGCYTTVVDLVVEAEADNDDIEHYDDVANQNDDDPFYWLIIWEQKESIVFQSNPHSEIDVRNHYHRHVQRGQ